MQTPTVLLLLCATTLWSVCSAGVQTVSVKGRLTCEGRPYGGAKIKLYDHDTFTIDDKLAETTSDSNGEFIIDGMGSERTRLNVKFNIYHRCRKTLPICYYKASFAVPYSYITEGPRPRETYDAQTIELSLLKKNRDCFN